MAGALTRRGLIGAGAAAAAVGLVPGAARATRRGGEPEAFHVGEAPYQAYVERVRAVRRAHRHPLVMIHGGMHTGACYRTTPDGRQGWASAFAEQGWDVYVVDWPGHGRAGFPPDFATMSMRRAVDALAALVERIGPVVLMGHSVGGTLVWLIGERVRAKVAAIVGIAPGGTANLIPPAPPEQGVPEHAPIFTARDNARFYWANSDRFPHAAFEAYYRTIVPESARVFNERMNVGGVGLSIAGPEALAGIPILVTTGDQDPRHPRALDEQLADWLGADFVWLPDVGLRGFGHMQMIEHGNLAVAALIQRWLRRRL